MKKLLVTLLLCCSLFHCTNMKTNNNTSNNCFSSDNFQQAVEIIEFRISVSGMGKFYITYPKEEGQKNDGRKRLPKNPDDVFDIYMDTDSKEIIMKSPKHHFRFHAQKGLFDRQKVNNGLADELFCYLLKIKK